MIKISKQVDYGLQILTALAKSNGQPMSLKRISDENDVSFLFLQKIARHLRAAGLIESSRGKDGGYHLSLPAEQITTRQVIEAIEGPAGLSACTRPGELCDKSHNCTVKAGVEELNAKLLSFFEQTTIDQLVTQALRPDVKAEALSYKE